MKKLKLQMFTEAGYLFEESRESAADKKGCEIVYPKENELQIDIDDDESYERFQAAFANLKQIVNAKIIRNEPSLSGLPHRHITIRLVGLYIDFKTRSMLQFMLGSDYIRESLAVLRSIKNVDNPHCLFEPIK